jgi:hypothetical protein
LRRRGREAPRLAAARPAASLEVAAGGGGASLDLVVERDGDLCGDERMHLALSWLEHLQSCFTGILTPVNVER